MAKQVVAYEGFEGKLYNTVEKADYSLNQGAVDEISRRLATRLMHRRSVYAEDLAAALMSEGLLVCQLADLLKKVGRFG